MSSFVKSYDLALKPLLYQRFASILGIDSKSSDEDENINLGIIQAPKDIALRDRSEKLGSISLEFISFWRTFASFDWKRQRTSVARRGMYVGTTDENKTDTVHVKAVPITLDYEVCFWSKDIDKIYQCDEKYVFWQQDNPKVTITYNDKYELTPDLHFGDIIDESSVNEKYGKGLIFVHRVPLRIDGWVLEGLSFKTIQKIRLTFYDKDEVTNYADIVVDDSNQDVELEENLRIFRRYLYSILGFNLVGNYILVGGNRVADFSIGEKILIENSTGNDGKYTITGVSLLGKNTKIVVEEMLTDSTVDGNVCKKSQ